MSNYKEFQACPNRSQTKKNYGQNICYHVAAFREFATGPCSEKVELLPVDPIPTFPKGHSRGREKTLSSLGQRSYITIIKETKWFTRCARSDLIPL